MLSVIRYDAAAGHVVLVEYHSVLSMISTVPAYVRSEASFFLKSK